MTSSSSPSYTYKGYDLPKPYNNLVTPLLTDLYQITMTYAHWKNNRHEESSIFELFFRKNPFGGEYTIFCGLDEVLKHLSNFKFTDDEINYLKSTAALSNCEDGFFEYLRNLDCSSVQVYAMKEGTLVFPREPLLVVSGPIGIAQLLETTLLTLVNYPSLIATNAARMVIAAENLAGGGTDAVVSGGAFSRKRTSLYEVNTATNEYIYKQCSKTSKCVEFGLRRAQGPDGGFSASKYSFIGGFAATSNVQAGNLLNINIAGTHAHSFIQSYVSLDEVKDMMLLNTKSGKEENLLSNVLLYRNDILVKDNVDYGQTNDSELAAYIAYAVAFPSSFLCLIDTYETLQSGLLNFALVALVLDDFGYTPRGVRLDSGDLAYLSLQCAKYFAEMDSKYDRPFFHELDIVASNDINENILHSLNKEGHGITIFGIGTNLVTCQAQPALGCVYKLVEMNGKPRIKLSQDIAKVSIPGHKCPYRLYGKDGCPVLDLLVGYDDNKEKRNIPKIGEKILCRHPFTERKRANVTPSEVVPLHHLVFDKENGVVDGCFPMELEKSKQYVSDQLRTLRHDHLRDINPTPYKVSVTNELFTFLHELWQEETPVAELS